LLGFAARAIFSRIQKSGFLTTKEAHSWTGVVLDLLKGLGEGVNNF
jgi:hypothetical protein